MGTFLNPWRFKKHLSVIFVFLLIGVNGSTASCKRGCPVSDRGQFQYKAGSVYAYNFESVITIAVTSAHEDETSIKVQGQASVYAESNCGFTLKLERVNVIQNKDGSGKGVSRKFTDGIDKPVQFTMANGELETQICTDRADTDFSVNLKRAIISMFQKSDKAHETDVFGVCPTTVSSTTNGNTEIVTKIRNLNACKYRETLSNGFVSGMVNERAGIKSTPLLTSDYSQDQEIANGIIKSVQVSEEYKFVPLTNAQNGAGVRAKVRTTLKLGKTSAGAAPALSDGVPSSIIFKNPRPVAVNNMEVLRTVLTATVNDLQEHVVAKSAQQLTELIRLMRSSSQQHLSTLYRDVRAGTVHPDKVLARHVFLDALFRVGTDESVAAITKFIENELDEREKRLAYMSFNLVDNVDEKSLNGINGLLDKNPPNEGYLSIGHLVNKYCRQHSCDQNRVVQEIATKFASKLNNCQAQSKKQEDSIISILKGIRNSGILASYAADQLLQCTSSERSARIRVATLQALATFACKKTVQSSVFEILRNRNEDSEIRIEAYLTVVACPSATVANQIAEIINVEPVYQVGSFISTHLRSIRDSTDAHRESARHHFSNIRVTKKFPFDPRRYSANRELSYAFESLGLGASADYTLIYSQQGFLPRSWRLNLTAELFGHDFNFFEVQGRQENLESMLQHYLGPKGFFTERSHDERRAKRSLQSDLGAMANRLRPYGNPSESILFDYSFKMFGNELVFLSMGDSIPADSDILAQKLETLLKETTDKAKNFEHDCKTHSLFLDTELVYPTGMGLPLQLIAQGSGIGRMKMAANIDLKDLPGKWMNDKYRVKFVPSFNIDVNGLMKVDAQVLSTGLKVRASLHASTGADVTLKITNGKDFSVDIDVPFKKQEIVNFQHDVEFVVEDPTKEAVHVPLKGKKSAVSKDHCFDQLAMFGLTVCGTFSQPGSDAGPAGFPLSGPTKFSLSLETEEKIHLSASHRHESGNKEVWLLRYDTPGSQRPHNTEVQFELGTAPKWYGRASFKHPEKFLALEAGLNNNENELVLYGQYEHDKDKTVAKVGFTKTAPNEYEPLIYIQTRDQPIKSIAGYSADGKIVTKKSDNGMHYNFQNIRILDQRGPTQRVVTMNGWVELGLGAISATGGPGLSMDMDVTDPQNKHYNVKSKFLIQAQHYVASVSLLNKDKPDASGSFSWELQHPEGSVKNDLNVAYGQELRHSYTLHNYFAYEADKTKPRYAKFENSFVSKDPAGSLKVNGQYARDLVEYDVEGSFRKSNIGSKLTLRRNQKTVGDYDADASIALNQYKAEVKAKRTIQDGSSLLDNTLTSSWGTSGSLKGKVSHRMTPIDAHIDLQGNLKISDKDDQFGVVIVFNATPKNSQGNFKLTRDAADLLTFSGNFVRGDNANGKFDTTVKDLLVGKGEWKSKSGAGDAWALFNLKKMNRKVRIESQYTMAAPTFNLDTTVFYDFEKDNAKKVTLNTKNQIDKHDIDSNSALEIRQDKYSFAVKGHQDGGLLQGNVNGNFNLGLPDGRQLAGELDRKMTKNVDGASGYANVKLTDSVAGGKQRSLEMNSKFSAMDTKARLFDIYHKFTYVTFDGKDGVFESHLKHLPKDHFKMAESSFSLKGSLVHEPIEFSLMVDEYCHEHAVYRMNGKYGDTLQGNMNGNYHVGGRAKPATFEIQVNIDAPKTELKTYKLQSSGSLLRPEVEGGVYEAKLHTSEQMGDWKTKIDGTAKGNSKHGSWSLNYDVPKVGPGKLDGSYLREEQDGNGKYQFNSVYENGQSKVIKMNLDMTRIGEKSVTLRYTLQTPDEHMKNLEVVFKADKSDDRSYIGNLQINHNDKSYGINTAAVLSDMQSSIDVTIDYPGRSSKFYGSLERLGEKKGRAKLKIENFGDFSFDGSAESSYVSKDSFYVKIDLDSKKLNLDRVHFEASSQAKPGGTIKGVEFKGTAGGKSILSGGVDFTIKQDKVKAVISGKGTVQLYDKTSQADFQLTRQMYDRVRDSETGFSYNYNGNFGRKNIVAELKMTTKNFILRLASCEEKKQCTNFEIRSVTIIEKDQLDSMQQKLNVLIDLREIGFPHEFELQSKLVRNGWKVEHDLEMNLISKSNTKYQFKTYMKPTRSGANLILPNREVVLENVYTIPEQVFGRYETSSALYFDKSGKPDEKFSLSFIGDLNRVEKTAINARGEVKFVHPTIKPLAISGSLDLNADRRLAASRVEFDIFKSPNQKIIATTKYQNTDPTARGVNITTEMVVKSDGLNFEYSFEGHTAVSFERQELSVGGTLVPARKDLRLSGLMMADSRSFEIVTIAFNEPVFTARGSFAPKKSELKAQYNVLGSTPVEFSAQSTGLSAYNFQLQRKNMYTIDGKVNVGKEATIVLTGSGKEMFNGRVALDPNHFLSTQYKVDENNFNEFMHKIDDYAKRDVEKARTEIDNRFKKIRENFERQIGTVKDSVPDFSGLQQSYENSMKEILDELSADPALHDIIEFYKRIFEAVTRVLRTVSQTLLENYKKLAEITGDMYEKMANTFKERILPLFQKYMKNLASILSEWYAETLKLLNTAFQNVAKTLKTFESDFNRIGKIVSEYFKSFNAAVTKMWEVLQKEFDDIMKLANEFFKSLPGLDEIKAAIKKHVASLDGVKQVVSVLNDMLSQAQDFLPTQEFKSFLKKLHDYIEAKLSEKDVNDLQQLQDLVATLVTAIRSMIVQFKSGEQQSSIFYPVPFTLDALRQIPVWTTMKFSPINSLRNEDWTALFRSLYKQTDPRDVTIPMELRAHIADGEHIFTFDGRHMTFPGSCSYVLVQDLENKFSVVANLEGGKMKSIVLTDRGNSVELSNDGQIKLNGKAAEYPIHNKDMHAWRRYYSVYALTEFGAHLKCSTDLRVCHVFVNGFYHGKTRGILGNGNNEPYDDFTLPNGKITDNYAELGNAYGLTQSCQPVPAEDHHQHHHTQSADPICKDLFDSGSSLMLGYIFIDPANYLEACNHAVEKSADKQDAACNIALTYASAARHDHIPVEMPQQCLKCKRSERALGDEFETKTPQKKADIIFVVDTGLKTLLNDLVQNVMTDLRGQLRQREMTDVHVTVIGYNENVRYPQIYTSAGGKLDFTGRLDKIDFGGAPTYSDRVKDGKRQLFNTYLDNWEKIVSQMIDPPDARAFKLAVKYPFRPEANRAIIAVRNDQLEYANVLKIVGAVFSNELAESRGISLHLIGPVKDFQLVGKPQQQGNVVGFNSRVAVMLSDAKKRSNFGSADLRSNIKYSADMGVDFVQEDGGYVFPLQNFEAIKDKPKERKQFTMVVANALADQIARTEMTNSCECRLRHGLFAEESCTVKDQNMLPPPQKKAAARG